MRPALLTTLLVVSCAASPDEHLSQRSRPFTQRVTVYVGERSLDDDHDPVEDQVTLGAEYSMEIEGYAVGFEAGFMFSGDDSDNAFGDVEAGTAEAFGGIRKTWGDSNVRPYLGAGISMIGAAVDVDGGPDDEDASLAGYAHAGVQFYLSEMVFLGVDVRVLFGSDIDLDGAFADDADYEQFAFVVGFSF